MAKALVLVPFALDESGVSNRRAQINTVELGPDIEFDFRPVTAGPELFMSPHDFVLMDLAIFEAGLSAQEDGYDAVCIDTMSDSGMDALRSVLDIPVISPGKSSMLFALMLGNKFALLAQWEPAVIRSRKFVSSLGLAPFCAAIEKAIQQSRPVDYTDFLKTHSWDRNLDELMERVANLIEAGKGSPQEPQPPRRPRFR